MAMQPAVSCITSRFEGALCMAHSSGGAGLPGSVPARPPLPAHSGGRRAAWARMLQRACAQDSLDRLSAAGLAGMARTAPRQAPLTAAGVRRSCRSGSPDSAPGLQHQHQAALPVQGLPQLPPQWAPRLESAAAAPPAAPTHRPPWCACGEGVHAQVGWCVWAARVMHRWVGVWGLRDNDRAAAREAREAVDVVGRQRVAAGGSGGRRSKAICSTGASRVGPAFLQAAPLLLRAPPGSTTSAQQVRRLKTQFANEGLGGRVVASGAQERTHSCCCCASRRRPSAAQRRRRRCSLWPAVCADAVA